MKRLFWLLWIINIVKGQNVGIGAPYPTAKLEIKVPITFTYPIFKITKQSNTYVIVDSVGKIGIAILYPKRRLHVKDAVRITSDSDVTTNIGSGAFSIINNSGAGLSMDVNEIQTHNGDLHINHDNITGTHINGTIHITTNNRVGIGVTTPSQRLDVNGNVQFNGALMPGGNAGTPGQVLVSQGSGIPPIWATINNVGGQGCSVDSIGPCVDTSGNPVSCPGHTMTLMQCVLACRTLAQSNYGGYNTWRTPTMDEFWSAIKKHGIPSIGPGYYYWTTTPHDGYNSGTYNIYYVFRFSDGYWKAANNYFELYYCRCVR